MNNTTHFLKFITTLCFAPSALYYSAKYTLSAGSEANFIAIINLLWLIWLTSLFNEQSLTITTIDPENQK